jgi:hypothetical protein
MINISLSFCKRLETILEDDEERKKCRNKNDLKTNGYYNLWGSAWLFNAKFVSYFMSRTHSMWCDHVLFVLDQHA